MRILAIGGTRFSGRAFTEAALARGHQVTVFHRGRNPAPAGVEEILGDRDADAAKLSGRRYDAVVDFCGFFPRVVRASVELLRDSGWYGFVSSISAHVDGMPPGGNEDWPSWSEPFPTEESLEHYGPLKVACEREVERVFGARAALVRPGFIVGPNDPSDRFPSLVRRASNGGEMLVPGPAGDWLQFVDARDLGAFLLHLAETGTGGVFDAVHPLHTATMGDVLRAAGGGTAFTFVDDADWLKEQLGDQREQAFPLWVPEEPGFHQLDSARAAGAGLRCRPVAETVQDTIAWDRTLTRERQHGLSAERERELLDRWRTRG